jgi:hypothetical protein
MKNIELALVTASSDAPPQHVVAWATLWAIFDFHRILPAAILGFAVIVNVAWMGFLGFEFFKLIEAAFV